MSASLPAMAGLKPVVPVLDVLLRIRTDMVAGAAPGMNEAFLARIPLGRLGEPAEVGAVVRFLASDEAAYLTGTTIDVGGGSYMP